MQTSVPTLHRRNFAVIVVVQPNLVIKHFLHTESQIPATRSERVFVA